jgi:hypothetical protein
MTETQVKLTCFDDLHKQIKAVGPTFDDIEFSVTTTWDEKNGSYRYCRMIRFVRGGDSFTVWIHTFKGTVTHVMTSNNGEDNYIDNDEFIYHSPSEWGIRKMIGEWVAEFMG